MAGILTPTRGIELFVFSLKEVITVPIVAHTHCTSGIAQLTYQQSLKLVRTVSAQPFHHSVKELVNRLRNR